MVDTGSIGRINIDLDDVASPESRWMSKKRARAAARDCMRTPNCSDQNRGNSRVWFTRRNGRSSSIGHHLGPVGPSPRA